MKDEENAPVAGESGPTKASENAPVAGESSPAKAPENYSHGGFQCWVCGAHRPSSARFDEHHVWGITSSEQTIMLCKRCHLEVSFNPILHGFRDLETYWLAMTDILQDRDWRVRMYFLKIMALAGDHYSELAGIKNPRLDKDRKYREKQRSEGSGA